MKNFTATLISLHIGNNEDLSKDACQSVQAELDGFVGDKHRGQSREAYAGDDEPPGTIRRNERQWSGVSVEELAVIQERLDLVSPLSPATLGANICVEGIEDFSDLSKGTKLVFPSGAVLLVEENNPPCVDMGEQVAAKYATNSGRTLTRNEFLRPAVGRRGVVGVVDVPGEITVGDEIIVKVYDEKPTRKF
ncbi:MAG: MOSC domain-containing protein [Gammaproteobacteria bacterium]